MAPKKVSHRRKVRSFLRRGGKATLMNLLTTLSGSLMEGFLPRGWDLARIDACASHPAESISERRPWWHPRFEPVACQSVEDFDVKLGPEIARAIQHDRSEGRASALILPVGPMGM
jgi:glucosamine-6-phosphate deaminase